MGFHIVTYGYGLAYYNTLVVYHSGIKIDYLLEVVCYNIISPFKM